MSGELFDGLNAIDSKKKRKLTKFVCDVCPTFKTAFNILFRRITFFSLRRIIYNFVNPHSELDGKTPAESAEILLPIDKNRLPGLIRIAVENFEKFAFGRI